MKKKTKLDISSRLFEWHFDDREVVSLKSQTAARILFYVILIHEFEKALLELKNDDCVWGPVHTSIGQEAVAAATVVALKNGDKFFGTHRSHHQFIAKVLCSALPQTWSPISDNLPDNAQDAVRRTLAEIMGLADGYCGGRGGSMHLRSAQDGFLGSNAIVAGGIPLSTGAAFTEKFNNTGNIIVCFFGDGATNQGAFHEACNLAGLWKLPVIFFLENNQYGVATSVKYSCSVQDLAIRAVSYGMDGHVVDGSDPVAIYHVIKQTAQSVRSGHGPCLIEAKCYRRYHHAGDKPGSAYKYRTKAEEKFWFEREVTSQFPKALLSKGILSEKDITTIHDKALNAVHKAVEACTLPGPTRMVRQELQPDPKTTATGFRSDGSELAELTYYERSDFSAFEDIRFSDAISAVTGQWLLKDSRTFILGEEVANFGGGPYGATKGLPDKYPDRILNTPISEAGFTGLAFGAAMSGMRPVIEIMFPDFTLVAADQIFNQIGKARHMYGNTTDIPLVLRTRIATGCGYGGQHSMNPIGLYALFSGWRIVTPANSFDYIGLFNTSMHSLDPVVIMEHHSLYTKRFPVPKDNLDYCIPFGRARIIAEGSDVTILTYGVMAWRCEQLQKR